MARWALFWAGGLLLCLAGLARRGSAAAADPHQAPFKHSYRPHEKELLDELQEVLEKLQHKKAAVWEKIFNQVPKCAFGDPCAVRKGARIGKLCDCPRRSACNAFLLKCL